MSDYHLIRMKQDYPISHWIRVSSEEDYIHIRAGEVLLADKFFLPPGKHPKPGWVYEVRGVWLAETDVEEIA